MDHCEQAADIIKNLSNIQDLEILQMHVSKRRELLKVEVARTFKLDRFEAYLILCNRKVAAIQAMRVRNPNLSLGDAKIVVDYWANPCRQEIIKNDHNLNGIQTVLGVRRGG
jgi:hypothetical protein